MGFLRRNEPQPVVEPVEETPDANPTLVREETVIADCWFCSREILLAPGQATDELVAIISSTPGLPAHGIAHRGCAERARS